MTPNIAFFFHKGWFWGLIRRQISGGEAAQGRHGSAQGAQGQGQPSPGLIWGGPGNHADAVDDGADAEAQGAARAAVCDRGQVGFGIKLDSLRMGGSCYWCPLRERSESLPFQCLHFLQCSSWRHLGALRCCSYSNCWAGREEAPWLSAIRNAIPASRAGCNGWLLQLRLTGTIPCPEAVSAQSSAREHRHTAVAAEQCWQQAPLGYSVFLLSAKHKQFNKKWGETHHVVPSDYFPLQVFERTIWVLGRQSFLSFSHFHAVNPHYQLVW